MNIELARRKIEEGSLLNIIISGPTCSGKTTLAKELEDKLSYTKVCSISQDSYYKDLKNIPKSRYGYLMDSVNAFETNEFTEDIKTLLRVGYVLIPNYYIPENRRISKDIRKDKGNVNILEGLHSIRLLTGIDNSLRIYMDTDLETCLIRRIERDKKYGVSEEVIRRYFAETMIPMYESYIKPQIEESDIIIRNEGDKECLLKKLIRY